MLLVVLECLKDYAFDSMLDSMIVHVRSSLCLSQGQLWNVDKGLGPA